MLPGSSSCPSKSSSFAPATPLPKCLLGVSYLSFSLKPHTHLALMRLFERISIGGPSKSSRRSLSGSSKAQEQTQAGVQRNSRLSCLSSKLWRMQHVHTTLSSLPRNSFHVLPYCVKNVRSASTQIKYITNNITAKEVDPRNCSSCSEFGICILECQTRTPRLF